MPAPANTGRKRARSLVVDITEDDEKWARKQNRYNCAIVRAIQRALPDALHVRADTKEIAFSLPQDDTRYYFQTPPEVVSKVIKPFDEGRPIEERTFLLEAAYAAEPIQHRNRAEMIAQRERERTSTRRQRPRTSSVPVHKLNRFLDYVAAEGDDQ